jgi:hypothetical protein
VFFTGSAGKISQTCFEPALTLGWKERVNQYFYEK